MKTVAALTVLLAIVAAGSVALAQSAAGSVGEIISARRGLMNELNSLQALIDLELASGNYDPATLFVLSEATAASFDAFALLLPPETNLQGGAPAVEGAETTASPTVWDDLPAYQQELRAIADIARSAMNATSLEEFKVSWDQVAATCESCHATSISFDGFGPTP